ncbi:MAG: hypothetical protein WD711_09620 [Dongiaceae bacterium]
MTGPNCKLENDRRTLTLSLPAAPEAVQSLDTQDVEELLRTLGECRGRMLPEIGKKWALGQIVGAVTDPRWYVEPETTTGGSLLHVRDSRFGWLHYIVPREEARKLGEYLIAQSGSLAAE